MQLADVSLEHVSSHAADLVEVPPHISLLVLLTSFLVVQMQELEASGGSLIEGAIAARRKARKAPKAPVLEQDAGLPAVPKGRTVVSFQGGLQALPKAMAAQLDNKLR